MKRVLSILLAVLVIAACATTEASTKKKRTGNRKAATTATVSKGAFKGFWAEPINHGLQLILEYNADDDTYSAELHRHEKLCSGEGVVKDGTLYLDCSDGYSLSCTLKGRKLIVHVNDGNSSYTAKMQRFE